MISADEVMQVSEVLTRCVLFAAAIGVMAGFVLGQISAGMPMLIFREWRRYWLLRRIRIRMNRMKFDQVAQASSTRICLESKSTEDSSA